MDKTGIKSYDFAIILPKKNTYGPFCYIVSQMHNGHPEYRGQPNYRYVRK